MPELSIKDLRNPRSVEAILLISGTEIVADTKDQGFQEYPGSWELWQMVDGRLMRVKRWLE